MKDSKKPWELRKEAKREKEQKRQILNTFIIFCEGENTEPEYFKAFPTFFYKFQNSEHRAQSQQNDDSTLNLQRLYSRFP